VWPGGASVGSARSMGEQKERAAAAFWGRKEGKKGCPRYIYEWQLWVNISQTQGRFESGLRRSSGSTISIDSASLCYFRFCTLFRFAKAKVFGVASFFLSWLENWKLKEATPNMAYVSI
jgi:hypothetical protein